MKNQRILSGGNYLWGNFSGGVTQGHLFGGQFSSSANILGAIVRGTIIWRAIIQGAIACGAIIREGVIFLGGSCPRTFVHIMKIKTLSLKFKIK